MPLSTACPTLDALLDGGLEDDAITLVFGEGGSGKTNLALQCAREVIAAGKKVAYVDTEGVSPRRLAQVFEGAVEVPDDLVDRLNPDRVKPAGAPGPAVTPSDNASMSMPASGDGEFLSAADVERGVQADAGHTNPSGDQGMPTDDEVLAEASRRDGSGGIDAAAREHPAVSSEVDGASPVDREPPAPAAPTSTTDEAQQAAADHADMMDQILFFSPFDIQTQEKMVQRTALLRDLGLIVVDSINMHYRLHIEDKEKEKEASRSLYKQLHHLTNFSRQYQVPVLVTGQVYGGEDATQPFARRVMEHLVKALVRFEKRPDGTRRATVLKHRSIEEGRQARFRIGAHGLEPVQ